VTIGATACNRGGANPVTASKSFDEIGQAWKSLANVPDEPLKNPLKLSDDSFRLSQGESFQTTINKVPTATEMGQMSPELKASIEVLFARVEQQQAFYREANNVITDISLRRLSAAREIEAIVDRSGSTLAAEAKAYVRKTGEDILHEVGCELAWVYLTEPERRRANAEVSSGKAETTYGSVIPTLLGDVTTASISAISSAGKAAYLKAYIDPEVVDWTMYGKGIIEKADKMTKDGNKTLSHPTDGPITYGFMYYVKVCMRLPA
jgi:hypothetical protein